MKEIGGYIELNQYHFSMLHEKALKLNTGRNCLKYLIKVRKIKKIVLPYFLCDAVKNVCLDTHVKIRYYHITENFLPSEDLVLNSDEWLYIVNYYGQLDNQTIKKLYEKHHNIILDYTHSYFQKPISGIDTLYTCRKFFGVADGALLYTDCTSEYERLSVDVSYDRMRHILGRFELSASDFYEFYTENEEFLETVPVKKMSRLTENLLHGIKYQQIKKIRTENYDYLFQNLKNINELKLKSVEGAYAYPLFIKDAVKIRKKLIENKIYIPILWPNVLEEVEKNSIDFQYAQNILPLPCDQRYTKEDMKLICELIKKLI